VRSVAGRVLIGVKPIRFCNRGTMDEFARAVVQEFVAAIRQLIYLCFFGFITIYALVAMFGINIWTFLLAHVAMIVLWIIKPIR
jgi:hypothetical protein